MMAREFAFAAAAWLVAALCQPAALAAEAVALRSAPHDGYARIVFDWKTPAAYDAKIDGRTLTVRFARPFSAKLEPVLDHLDAYVSAIRMAEDGRTVVATLKGDYRLRNATDKGIVILDLLAGRDSASPAPKPVPARAAAKIEPAAGPAQKPPPAKAPEPPPSAAAAAPPKLPPPTPLIRDRKIEDKTPAKPSAAADKTPPVFEGGLVSVDVVKGRDITALRFNWREDTSATVFQRRGHGWVVFDTPARIELGSLQINGAPAISGADQFPVAGGTAVRFGIDPSRHLRVRREGTIWVVEVIGAPPADTKPIAVVVEPGVAAAPGPNPADPELGGRIVLPVAGARKVLTVKDPEVGDSIQAVTLGEAGIGVAQPRRFVELDVLESAQGIAVRPTADQVTVQALARGVVVSRPGGLRLSRDADRAKSQAAAPPRAERLYDLVAWGKGPSPSFFESREELTRRAAVAANEPDKRKARLELARFFLANAFGPEALGVINEIVRTEAGKNEDVTLRALRGAARVLSGEFALAGDDFKHPVLEAHTETGPWRAAIAAARGDWKTAQQQFRDLEKVLPDYPSWLSVRFGLMALESSLAIGDTGAAKLRLDSFRPSGLSADDRDALTVLRGHYLKRTGDVEGAIALWREVARSDSRQSSARARYALTNALLDRNEITPDEAIDRMERLRYAWRGDVFEFDLLRRVAQLYADRNDIRHSLQTLKEAATYFRDIEGVQAVAVDMAALFRRLFVDGGADSLPPVAALALFEEFRELTPTGAEGDAMVRRLADRLVTVDLLGDAARLLEQQVKFRLGGEEKARVGARLAGIRLMDRKPKAALAALADSAVPEIPAELARDRVLIQARALAALDRPVEAIAALSGDDGDLAERIRAGIHWRNKAWREAADSFGRLVDRSAAAGAGDDLVRLVLSQAVALALAGDDKGVAALRAKHGATMKKSAFADAFNAVAGPEAGAIRDFRAAAQIAGEIDALQALLAQRREAAAPGPKPAVIN